MAAQAHTTFMRRYDMRRNSAVILRTFEQLNQRAAGLPSNLPETH